MAISTMVNAKPLFAVRKTEGSQGDGESHLTYEIVNSNS
jgi:hypothetical protein